MKLPGTWWLVLAVALCGCRGTTSNQQLLERELRVQEDKIFRLEDRLEHYRTMLASCRQQNARLMQQLPVGGEQLGTPIHVGPPIQVLPPIHGIAPESIPPFKPPVVVPPRPGQPEGIKPRVEPSQGTPPPFEPPPGTEFLPVRPSAATMGPSLVQPASNEEVVSDVTDYHVMKVTLNKRLSGGWNADRQPGDEGVMLLLELRNANDQVLNVPAAVSVVVVDPALPAQQWRVARWDFTPDEAADKYRKTLFGSGIMMQLGWPAAEPVHTDLQLHVKIVTEDGRELRTERPLQIELPPGPEAQLVAGEQQEVMYLDGDAPIVETELDPALAPCPNCPPHGRYGPCPTCARGNSRPQASRQPMWDPRPMPR